MRDYKDVVNILGKGHPVDPPDDFTQSVMERIAMRGKSFLRAMPGGKVIETIVGRVNKGICVLQFIMIGVFYLILSVMVKLGFDRLPETIALPEEVGVQFYFAYVFAVSFILLGIAFLRNGNTVARIAEFVTLLYVMFVLANGIIFLMSVPVLKFIVFSFFFTGAMVGLLLELTVRRYREILEYGTD
jgi:hypothetical protein